MPDSSSRSSRATASGERSFPDTILATALLDRLLHHATTRPSAERATASGTVARAASLQPPDGALWCLDLRRTCDEVSNSKPAHLSLSYPSLTTRVRCAASCGSCCANGHDVAVVHDHGGQDVITDDNQFIARGVALKTNVESRPRSDPQSTASFSSE